MTIIFVPVPLVMSMALAISVTLMHFARAAAAVTGKNTGGEHDGREQDKDYHRSSEKCPV